MNKRHKLILAFVIAIMGSIIISITMGPMNIFVVAAYLFLFWVICKGSLWLFSRISGKSIKPYIAGILALVITTGYLGYAYYKDHNVVLTKYEISTDKTVDAMNIVFFSDSHVGATFDGEEFGEHIDTINALKPDVVLIAGDLIDGYSKEEDIIKAAKQLSRLEAKNGVYFIFGNHDKNQLGQKYKPHVKTDTLRAELEANGINILEDEQAELPGGYTVVGRRDEAEDGRASIDELMENVDLSSFIIDMNHQPTDYANETNAKVDLVLSGHTHGGQFLLLRNVSLWLGINDRVYGYEKREDTNFIVSSGISNWGVDFKTGCISEIVQINVNPTA